MPNGAVDLAGRRASVRNFKCLVPVLSRGAFARSFLLASAAAIASVSAAAQTSRNALPPVTVDAPQQKRAAAARPPQRSGARAARVSRVSNPAVAPVANDQARGPALTVLTVQQALRDIQQTPGGVAIVPAEAYRNSTVANTIKDVLDYVPGVFAQPKWGDDTRLSIRGSGLSRNFHLRGVQLYMDGIPINTADGYGDFQEIDPTAYKYVAVYKGANALQFGANSLGGAINFVTPTGRDPFPNGVSARYGRLWIPPAAGQCRRRQRSVGRLCHRLDASGGGIQGSQLRAGHARQRQCRLSVLARCRDPVLPQRQRSAAAHSRAPSPRLPP